MKKNILTLLFVLLVAAVVAAAVFFLGKNKSENAAPVSSAPSSTSSVRHYTLEETVQLADTVITGSIIKADVDSTGVLYTMNVQKVYKGRNYTSMGYAYVLGKQTLNIGKSYLFIGNTGSEKYHYYAPFENAPWVFEVLDGNTLSAAPVGDSALISNGDAATLDQIISLCDII